MLKKSLLKLPFDLNASEIVSDNGERKQLYPKATPPVHTVVLHSTGQSVNPGHAMMEALQVTVWQNLKAVPLVSFAVLLM